MSGGAWQYGQPFHEDTNALLHLAEVNQLMIVIEKELDWGVCGDTCLSCAQKRVLAALENFFEHHSADRAANVARNKSENQCEKCLSRCIGQIFGGSHEQPAQSPDRQ